MTSEAWEKAVEAMRTRRKELIAQPIDRVYGELLSAAFPILAEGLVRDADAGVAMLKAAGASDDGVKGANAIALTPRARIDQMKERG